MLKKIVNYLQTSRTLARVNMALSRAQSGNYRNLCAKTPTSWEFCGFSQNGEDGIIDYLCQKIINPNRYFVEIGAADGLENNTAWLAIARKFSGLMIEGSPQLAARAAANENARLRQCPACGSEVGERRCRPTWVRLSWESRQRVWEVRAKLAQWVGRRWLSRPPAGASMWIE